MTSAEAFGDEAVERLPDGLIGRTEKHSLSSAIEDEDALLAVNRDDGVHCRIDDPGQPSLALAQRLPGLPAVRRSGVWLS